LGKAQGHILVALLEAGPDQVAHAGKEHLTLKILGVNREVIHQYKHAGRRPSRMVGARVNLQHDEPVT
jgi:hypothetical protein